jgi:hypothetical protein
MHLLFLGLALWLAIMVAVMPVGWAATAVGARKTGFGACCLALVCASVLHGIGLQFPVLGSMAAFLLSAAGFAAVLGTTYAQGIAIAALHLFFMVVLLFVVSFVTGIVVVTWLAW